MAKCKDCGKFKGRVRSTRRRQKNRFYYVTKSGRLWNGRQCPDCKVFAASGVEASVSKNIAQGQEEEQIDECFIYC